jgi:two-component system CheB/CheR fusion protein
MRVVARFAIHVEQLVSRAEVLGRVKLQYRKKISGADATDGTAANAKADQPSGRRRGSRPHKALIEREASPAGAAQPAGAARSRLTAAAASPEKKPSAAAFPIVGIGASAGGLEAFTELLKQLPLDTGMGFVLVQHLDPQHESALTHLLARATAMPVCEVTNNLRVEVNHVYVIPPNTNLGIEQGVLKLQPRQEGRAPHHSVDFFFESLATDQGERAIGVILSGTASDGTVGLEAVKAEGGITFAQDDSARFDSMPRSAIAAGFVDFVLSPGNIAKELVRIAKHPYVAGQPPGPAAPTEGEKESAAKNRFDNILLLLRHHSGVDFSLYKSSTVQRRIARRMLLNKIKRPEAYATFLRGKANELEALYRDMLISVTTFFRNPAAFDVLREKVFPRLFELRRDQPLRVWVLGCSTGQEAYSIAMSFVEFAEQAGQARKLQLFATDVNEALLDNARAGTYAESLMHDLSPERLRRFFVKEDGGYRAAKSLREMVVFARQNLLTDPPFSRMDLVSCRNVLIYLDADAQRKVLPTLHYALKPEGFLFLGESESIGPVADLFEIVDKKCKIYSKKPGLTAHLHFAPRHPGERKEIPAPKPPVAPGGFNAEINAQREADRITLNRYAPPGVLLNAQWQVLQFRGETSPFLKPPVGSATFHVLKMARQGLMLPLRAALKKSKQENKAVRREGVQLAQNGGVRRVNFDVVPLTHFKEGCYLVFFEEAKVGRAVPSAPSREQPNGTAKTPRPPRRQEESRRAAELERELAETRDYLQSVQDQSEAANEELQASSEEVTSANEELQSTNEELETSKEELESANEELTTLNDEMAHRNAELSRANADLNNLHASINLPILVLTRDLAIRRFTAPAANLFNLVDADAGRPLSNVRHNLDLPDLEALLKEVIDTISEREREARDKTGRYYSLRARPYLTLDNKIDGAVLVLVDIDALKRTEQAIAVARDYAANVIRSVRDSLLILDADLRVQNANQGFYKTFQVSPAESEGRLFFELGNGQWKIPRLCQLLEGILPRNSFFNDYEVTHDFERIGRRTMLLNARKLAGDGAAQGVLVGIQDITEILQFQAATR